MEIKIDIETLPNQDEGVHDRYLKEAADNFKAPSGMTKAQMWQDLLESNARYANHNQRDSTAEDVRRNWEDEFCTSLSVPIGEENYRKTALTDDGVICVVCTSNEDGLTQHSKLDMFDNEMLLLSKVFSAIKLSLNQREPYFIGHNVAWDLERLFHKAVMYGINPGFKLPFDGRHGKDYYDTQQAWAGYKYAHGKKGYISQKDLCARLGIETKTDMDGSQVWDIWQEDPERVVKYCMEDVLTVEKLHKRLTFQEIS